MTTGPDPRMDGMPITGHQVLDDQHQKVGTISDVIYDEQGTPRWAVVDPGPLRAEHFVPVEGAYTTAEGDVVVPYGKEHVKAARKAGRDHLLNLELERELEEHYELTPRR